MMTNEKLFISILIISGVTIFTRAFPFLLFSKENKKPSKIIIYLGDYLPPAIICSILVYCLRDISFTKYPFGAREIISVIFVGLLHFYKSNTMLSICGGTFVYMVLTKYL